MNFFSHFKKIILSLNYSLWWLNLFPYYYEDSFDDLEKDGKGEGSMKGKELIGDNKKSMQLPHLKVAQGNGTKLMQTNKF